MAKVWLIVAFLINPIDDLFSLIGQGFGGVKGALAGGLDIFNKASNILQCKDSNDRNACPVSNEYILKTHTKNPRCMFVTRRKTPQKFSRCMLLARRKSLNINFGTCYQREQNTSKRSTKSNIFRTTYQKQSP